MSRSRDNYYAFRLFHANNPHIYVLFKRFVQELREAGRISYSSRAIFHRIRWHTTVETVGEPFKINNNHSPYYADMFIREHPHMAGFFQRRISRAI